jgi:hypothetical protein
MPTIRINRIAIHLEGISSREARRMAGDLGQELAGRLGGHKHVFAGRGRMRVSRIDSGSLVGSSSRGATGLAARIAERIAGAVAARTLQA